MTVDLGFLEFDVDVQDWDSVILTAYVVVPSVIPEVGGKHQIGPTTTLGPGRETWSASLAPIVAGTGFAASVTLTFDVNRACVVVDASLDVKLAGVSVSGFPQHILQDWVLPWPKPPIRPIGTGQIAHVVVLMMENRSFDNILGWLYKDSGNRPPRNVPSQPAPTFDGLVTGKYWCPREATDIAKPDDEVPEGQRIYVTERVTKPTIPSPDPFEQFRHMNYQLFGTEQPQPSAPATMKGFVVNYAAAIAAAGAEGVGGDPTAIMQAHAPDQLPVISALARNYAVCDRWFASVPCQTWPNRAFVHAGTSCGRVNNLDTDTDSNSPPNPLYYATRTIFNVLQECGVTWKVYGDSPLPTLTRAQFCTELASLDLSPHFRGFGEFKIDARMGMLPAYSFVEPDFMVEKNDAHPPHDVAAADAFIYEVWQAISTGKAWQNTLLIITFDEHGGCYDHVPPPWTAVAPDDSTPQKPFGFNRYGVRIPTILVSPWIEPGTVFRAPAADAARGAEFDHTSILATLRDWQDVGKHAGWLKSKRIAAAPTIATVLTRAEARTDVPSIPPPNVATPPANTRLNDIQRSVVANALTASKDCALHSPEYASVMQQVSALETVGDALAVLGLGEKAPRSRARPVTPTTT